MRAPCAMAPSGNRTPERRGAQTHSASAFVTRVWMVYQRALSLSLYLADAGVSPELEALKRGFMRGESPELGPLKREGRACARAAREREALAKRSSARTQALKPSLARSLARR